MASQTLGLLGGEKEERFRPKSLKETNSLQPKECIYEGKLTSSIAKPLNKGERERHGAVHLEEKTGWQIHAVGVAHSGKGWCA